MDVKEMQQYRNKLYDDLYAGIIPDRFTVEDAYSFEYILQRAGYNLLTTQFEFKPEIFVDMLRKAMPIKRGDTLGLSAPRNALQMVFQKSRIYTMSKSGMIQHPEFSGFDVDEYDAFIKNPHEFLVEKVLPRIYPSYAGNPVNFAVNYTKTVIAQREMGQMLGGAIKQITQEYGLYEGAPAGSAGNSAVPFDLLADVNRGFVNISKDIKRNPQKVLDAVDALMPMIIENTKTKINHPRAAVSFMTHMGAFLNTKDFEKFYWPTFFKLCHIIAERGQNVNMFLENDWSRFVDLLSELPVGTRMYAEYGDPQYFKDKLGNKMILGGFYPISVLRNGTKEECIDMAKKIIDTLAPGGNFFFRFDKRALALSDVQEENHIAVMEYLIENGKYANAGQKSITLDRKASIRSFSKEYPAFKSKYIVSFEDFIKDYPLADESVYPIMKQQYEKYAFVEGSLTAH